MGRSELCTKKEAKATESKYTPPPVGWSPSLTSLTIASEIVSRVANKELLRPSIFNTILLRTNEWGEGVGVLDCDNLQTVIERQHLVRIQLIDRVAYFRSASSIDLPTHPASAAVSEGYFWTRFYVTADLDLKIQLVDLYPYFDFTWAASKLSS
jgi:hypothetical protein